MKSDTVAIHYGYQKDMQKTMSIPIYQSTAYEYDSTDHAANLFALKESGNIYTRIGNPTTSILEQRLAKLENGVGAIAVSSGMAAINFAILNICQSGDNIIASSKLYGGTMTLFAHTIKRLGITTKFVDIDNLQAIEDAIDANTKAIFYESISNPGIEVCDIQAINNIANNHNILSICDNTVATPSICKPIDFGCDIVVHSMSKYIGGQGNALGGMIVESPNTKSKLDNNPKYQMFNEPDSSYHGLVYSELESAPFVTRARLALLRDFGSALGPFESWLFLQGLETLSLRIEKHSSNAMEIANFLSSLDKVKSVRYPLLEDDKSFDNANRYLSDNASGLVAFEVEDFETAKKIANSVHIFSRVTNIGDTKSIITHPASTTHQQLSKEELENAGISQGLIRLSVGIENSLDLVEDLLNAIDSECEI
jgi:O-acetylhomoserine (thiol)-lyase